MGQAQLDVNSSSVRWCPSCRAVYRADFARCPVDGDPLEVGDTDPLIGTTLGQHYVIDAFLGEGAMARVYRAHHALLTNKQFAVKVMIGDLAATLEMRLRFAAEADAASQLNHPNVVSVLDFGRSEKGLMYIVMELVTGKTLYEVIQETGPIAPRRAMALARQIMQGLAHAHEAGLVHRDLKPENIIISGQPELARIVDFGLAIADDDERSTRLTAVGLSMGTPIYAAPEQTHNEPVDHRADLFALGVTIFEMLTGKPPFEGGIVDIIRQNAADVMPPIVGKGNKRVSAPIEAVVRKLMRREPKDRYQSAKEVLDALEAAQLAPSKIVSLPLPPSMTFSPAFVSGKIALPTPEELAASEPVLRARRPYVKTMVGVIAASVLALGAIYVTNAENAPAPAISAAEPAAVVAAPVVAQDVVAPAPPPVEESAAVAVEVAAPAPRVAAPVTARAIAPTPGYPVAPSARPVVTPRAVPTPSTAPAAKDVAPVADEAFHEGPNWLSEIPPPPTPAPASAPEAPKADELDDDASMPPRPSAPPAPGTAKPAVTTANVTVGALRVAAGLDATEVRTAVDTLAPNVRACYWRAAQTAQTSPSTTVRVSLSIDDSRRASGIRATGSTLKTLDSCVASTMNGLRVTTAPAGTIAVSFDLAFQPETP